MLRLWNFKLIDTLCCLLLSLSALLEFTKLVQKAGAFQMVLWKGCAGECLCDKFSWSKDICVWYSCLKLHRGCAVLMYCRIHLIWRPQDQTGTRLWDNTCTDLSCHAFFFCARAEQLVREVFDLDVFLSCWFFKISQPALRECALISYFILSTKDLTYSVIICQVIWVFLENRFL
jgi:hypothetical protein